MKKLTLMLVLCLPVCASAEKFKGLAPTPPMGWNSWNTFALCFCVLLCLPVLASLP